MVTYNNYDYSVLMSVYIKENPNNFDKALESMINQTIKPSEIVIVCDGKLNDELYQILEKYEILSKTNKIPMEIVRLELETNLGLGEALRIGILKTRYNYIVRMDTDDIAANDRVEKQIQQFQKIPNLVLVGSNVLEFDVEADLFDVEIKNSLKSRVVPMTDLEIKKYSKTRNPFNHMTVMFKKDVVLEAGNYRSFLYCEDYDLWMRMLHLNSEYKFSNIQENLVYMRVNSDTYKRRGGIKYAISEIKLQYFFWRKKYINFFVFLKNLSVRSIVRLIPNQVRGFIYKCLRK